MIFCQIGPFHLTKVKSKVGLIQFQWPDIDLVPFSNKEVLPFNFMSTLEMGCVVLRKFKHTCLYVFLRCLALLIFLL